MKAVKIDVYWDHFKKGGIVTGQELMRVNEEMLIVSTRTHKPIISFPFQNWNAFFKNSQLFIIFSFS